MATMESQQAIYSALAAIPAGKVSSYGSIARLAGLPGAARLVGRLLKHLPKNSNLPWHRVIRADGRIAFPAGSAAFQRQQARLEKEGVSVQSGRISFQQFGWPPPAPAGVLNGATTKHRTG